MKLRILLPAALLLLLVSCTSEAPDAPSALTVRIADFAEGDAVVESIVDATAYCRTVTVSVNEDVSALRYIAVESDLADDRLTLTETETLFSLDTLHAGEAVAIQLSFPELLPNRALTLTDRDGTQHCYYFAESNKDGSLLLVEYGA